LPPRAGARRRRLAELDIAPWTIVILLSPHRLSRELADAAEVLGEERPATLLAEISKRHERARCGTLAELARGKEARSPRGEYVLVVGPPQEAGGAAVDAKAVRTEYLRALDGGMDRRQALREVARRLGIRKREAFDHLIDDLDTEGD
jgi:16S rRNA (cytidine1402-2'-O)-methyltransferase